MATKVIRTSYGLLKGLEKVSKSDKFKYWSYQGIPYAKPPVGNLRFKDPEDLEPWDGVRDALKEGNHAPHFDLITFQFSGDEDCLFLNVYVPQVPSDSPLPVMVWIHGGGFAYGHADADVYGPEFLINKSVIVVTFNYRLGVLGFLNLQSKEASGNQGLKDQAFALKWVNKEIQNFGGDPKNITLFGESAGGTSVHFHMISPLSNGLFQKAIIMSGSALCPWAFTYDAKVHVQRAFDLGKLLGSEVTEKEELLKFLHSVSSEKFASLQDRVISQNDHISGSDQAFVPTVDGVFLEADPLQYLKKGNIADIPTIIGVVSHEGFIMHRTLTKTPEFYDKWNEHPEVVVPYPYEKSTDMAEGLRKVYFENEAKISYEKHSDKLYKLYGDVLFQVPIVISLKYQFGQTSRKAPVYMYRFSYDGNLGWLKSILFKGGVKLAGVSHGDDLGYLLSNDIIDYETVAHDKDKQFVDQYTTIWTNFAKTGNPNENNQPGWSPMSNIEDFEYLEIEGPSKFTMKQHLDKDQMDFWISKI